MIRYEALMEQAKLTVKNKFFSSKLIEEIISYAKLAIPMFFTQLATQLIGVASVVMAGNYSSEVLAGILLANSVWCSRRPLHTFFHVGHFSEIRGCELVES